jgi:hypothetical protein
LLKRHAQQFPTPQLPASTSHADSYTAEYVVITSTSDIAGSTSHTPNAYTA